MQKNFKLLTLKVFKFMVMLFVVDLAFGHITSKIYFNQKTGKQARITYSLQEAANDIFIFGSSHANRHYVPEVFQKQLGQTCYNAGVQGQGVIFHSVLQKIILERTKPNLIILNIDDNWLYERQDAYDRLSDLHPYYWDYREEIRPAVSLKSKLVDFKLIFKAYQNNSTLVHAFRYFVSPQKDSQGYLPLKGKMKTPSLFEDFSSKTPSQIHPIDENFVSAYQSFIQNAKKNNVEVLIVISPLLDNRDLTNDISLNKMKEIAKAENIPLLDLYEHPKFQKQYDLFDDFSHLNDKGARLFSELVSELIIELEDK